MTRRPIVGLDLGTTHSCVGVFRHGKVEIVPNTQGNTQTFGCVAFTNTGHLAGDAAEIQAVDNLDNTVYDVKRLIGRDFSDRSVAEGMKIWPFSVIDEGGRPKVCVDCKRDQIILHPEEISAMLLKKMKEAAETYLGETITDAVLTVPASFNDSQRQATRDAATVAGLNIVRLLNESTASAIAYGFDKQFRYGKNVLVLDLGGGKLDVSLLYAKDRRLSVVSSAGDNRLGGEDFDTLMARHFLSKFRELYGEDISSNKTAVHRLRRECERAKITLSSRFQANIMIDSLVPGIDYYTYVERECFESLCDDLFQQTIRYVDKVLTDAGLPKSNVDEIVLSGGSTRIPKLQQLITSYFNGKELCHSINPEEAAAYGATVLAARLLGESSSHLQGLTVSDVAAHSLCVKKRTDAWTPIINRNKALPASFTETFHISQSNRFEDNLQIEIFEGQRVCCGSQYFYCVDTMVGSFQLAMSPVISEVYVKFDVDADGILRVSASDNRRREIIVKSNKRCLCEEELQKLVRNSESYRHESDDEKTRLEAKNVLESYAIFTLTTVMNNEDILTTEEKEIVQDQCYQVLSWLDRNKLAGLQELEYKQSEIIEVCCPIINKKNLETKLPEHLQQLDIDSQACLPEQLQQLDIDSQACLPEELQQLDIDSQACLPEQLQQLDINSQACLPEQLQQLDINSQACLPEQLQQLDINSQACLPEQLQQLDINSRACLLGDSQFLDVDSQTYIPDPEASTPSDIDLLLIGKTGNGKSATGNAILRTDCFHSASSTSSVTTVINFGYAEYKGKVFKVVDGPGVGDTRYDVKGRVDLVINEVSKAMLLNPRGYHAFLLVVRYGGRFTDEDKETIELLKQMFGQDFVRNHCILIMTCGDLFDKENEKSGKMFDQWCEEQIGVFRDLLDECCGRVVLFDNWTTDEAKQDAQVDQLLDTLRQLQMAGHRYTDDNFRRAAAVRQKARVEAQKPDVEEEIHKEISLITQALNQEITKVKRSGSVHHSRFSVLSTRCNSLIRRIRAGDKGTGVLADLETRVIQVKQSVDRTLELQTCILQERESTRKEMDSLRCGFRMQYEDLESQLVDESAARKRAERRSIEAHSLVRQERERYQGEVNGVRREFSETQQNMARQLDQAGTDRDRAEQQQNYLRKALRDVEDKNNNLVKKYKEIKDSDTRSKIVAGLSTVAGFFSPIAGMVISFGGCVVNKVIDFVKRK